MTFQMYPEHMKAVTIILEGLNDIHKRIDQECGDNFALPCRVPIKDKYGDLLGYAIDEIGGSFSFVTPSFLNIND